MIRVSDISTYLKCPRMCYFVYKGHNLWSDISSDYIERIILKELALRYASAYYTNDVLSILNNELDSISSELRGIYAFELGKVDDSTLAACTAKVRLLIKDICLNLSSNGDFFSGELLQDDLLLRSDRFGFSGSPDRLVRISEGIVPSIIKTGNMPDTGIWKSDRIQLTAYSILVEEKYNLLVEKGFVEYARHGIVRPVIIKRHDRRKVFQIRDRIKKIQEGLMPERPQDAPCIRCGFTGICDVKSTFASKFF